MDTNSFRDFYIDPISLDQESQNAPLPQVFKDISIIKIGPEEQVTATRNTYTFINKNLDIITMPHEAYLYVRTTNNASAGTAAGKLTTLGEHNSVGIPSSSGLIDGFDYLINDTTVCTRNNSLASTTYAVNNAIFAPDSKSLEHLGLSDPRKGPINLQKEKVGVTGACEWIIPLKYVVPFLSENKILWGVKQTLKITKADVASYLYNTTAGTAVTGGTTIELTDIELRMPYVKLENQKQLALWNTMYANTINRYWLDCDQFWSSHINNTSGTDNSIFRVATKGLNSRPRYLLLHAVDPNGTNDEKHKPMGFGPETTVAYDDNVNTVRFKKLRIKLNGIYVDNGDVMEMFNVSSANGANAAGSVIANNPHAHHRDYTRSYDDYCKYFGQYHSKRDSVKSFKEWLRAQIYVFDLTNIDSEQIFANSGSALIIEIEYSTFKGAADATNSEIKLIANVLYDKQLVINHSENKATLTIT